MLKDLTTKGLQPGFHDYLGLTGRDLSRYRVLVFCGGSGSGKSSYIEWLTQRRQDQLHSDHTLLDEVQTVAELQTVKPLLHQYHQVLVASHLPVWRHWMLHRPGTVKCYEVDRYPEKIKARLDRAGVVASPDAIRTFYRQFGANYTDLAIILERYPGLTFGQMLQSFHRECQIEQS